MSQLPDLPPLPDTCGNPLSDCDVYDYAKQYAALAVAAERERCAKICEDLGSDGMSWLEAGTCAAAIRSQP